MPKVLTKAEKNLRERLIIEGVSFSEVARRLDLNPSTISIHAKRYDLRKYRKTPIDKARIIEGRLKNGETVAQISRDIGIPVNTIYNLMRRFGLKAIR